MDIILHLDDFVDFCCTTLRRFRRHMLNYTHDFVDLTHFAQFSTLKDFVGLAILLHLETGRIKSGMIYPSKPQGLVMARASCNLFCGISFMSFGVIQRQNPLEFMT